MEKVNVYDPNKIYAFTNWTSKDFTGFWDKVPYVIKAGEVREFPQYLAFHFCKYLVDRELTGAGKDSAIGDEARRLPLEEKTIRPVHLGEESPELVALRDKIRKEVKAQLSNENAAEAKAGAKEHIKEDVPEKIVAKKLGRPKKEFEGVE